MRFQKVWFLKTHLETHIYWFESAFLSEVSTSMVCRKIGPYSKSGFKSLEIDYMVTRITFAWKIDKLFIIFCIFVFVDRMQTYVSLEFLGIFGDLDIFYDYGDFLDSFGDLCVFLHNLGDFWDSVG